jgi:hypothetical protein
LPPCSRCPESLATHGPALYREGGREGGREGSKIWKLRKKKFMEIITYQTGEKK